MSSLSNDSKQFLRMFLQASTIPSYPNCYILGSFDFKKTISTQLNRAATMALAVKEKTANTNGKVAIIGGGFGGLMCATTFLRLGYNVTLFECGSALLPLQKSCYDRYLHPTSYDWPLIEMSKNYTLGGIKWDANFSEKVCSDVLNCFDDIRTSYSNAYEEKLGFKIRQVVHLHDTSHYALIDSNNFRYNDFSTVVLAIGFGQERHVRFGDRVKGYWANSEFNIFDSTPDNPKRLLISGAGDGSLISIINSIFLESNHSRLIDIANYLLNDELIDLLIKAEHNFIATWRDNKNPSIIHDYDEIFYDNYDMIRSKLPCIINPGIQVTFNSNVKGIFTIGSSILNRVLVYLLYRANIINVREDRLEENMVTEEICNGIRQFTVRWLTSDAENYDHIITRHGVIKQDFSNIFKCTEDDLLSISKNFPRLELEKAIPKEIFSYINALNLQL